MTSQQIIDELGVDPSPILVALTEIAALTDLGNAKLVHDKCLPILRLPAMEKWIDLADQALSKCTLPGDVENLRRQIPPMMIPKLEARKYQLFLQIWEELVDAEIPKLKTPEEVMRLAVISPPSRIYVLARKGLELAIKLYETGTSVEEAYRRCPSEARGEFIAYIAHNPS